MRTLYAEQILYEHQDRSAIPYFKFEKQMPNQPTETSSSTLQRLVTPETLCGYRAKELYLRGDFYIRNGSVVVPAGAHLRADTYFNCFSAGKWRAKTTVENVQLRVRIESGSGELRVVRRDHFDILQLISIPKEFDGPDEFVMQLPLSETSSGIVFWEIVAKTKVLLASVSFSTNDTTPREPVRLGLVVTAFKRDMEVNAAIKRFRDSAMPAQGHKFFVIDNGLSLTPGVYEWGQIIPNVNLGGAGGFTRGLIELKDNGAFTHALFMDDDASTHIESIERAIALLQFARSDDLAVSGAMFVEEEPWLQHEAGAQFKEPWGVRPLFHLKDMRDPWHVLANEDGPHISFGAWWFFAFPISAATHLAFPFFVRGDDQQFSRANTFDIMTMNGIASWQPRFDDKITPSVEYLVTRSEFLIGLLKDQVSTASLIKLAAAVFAKIIEESLEFRYGMAGARCDAVSDVLDGPQFWERQPSAVPKFAELKQKYAENYPVPVSLEFGSMRFMLEHPRRSRVRSLLRILTLGGHLIPNLFLNKKMAAFPALFVSKNVFFQKRVLYFSPRQRTGYVATKSLSRFIGIVMRASKLAVRIVRSGKKTGANYALKMHYLQSEQFWRRSLNLRIPGGHLD